MAYTKTNWIDGTTPANETNLNHLETQYDEAKAYSDALRINSAAEIEAEVVADHTAETPAAGRIVFDSSNGFLYHGNGSAWVFISNGPHNSATYTTPGSTTFTVPDGVIQITFVAVGGGGGGGGGYEGLEGVYYAGFGGGGGGGGCYMQTITVTPAEEITVVVGAGGAGGAAETSGVAGGNSSVGTYIAYGGASGVGYFGGGAGGGIGGSGGAGGGIGGAGGAGGDGGSVFTYAVAGAGGNSITGTGGVGGIATGGSGGNGTNGKVVIIW